MLAFSFDDSFEVCGTAGRLGLMKSGSAFGGGGAAVSFFSSPPGLESPPVDGELSVMRLSAFWGESDLTGGETRLSSQISLETLHAFVMKGTSFFR